MCESVIKARRILLYYWLCPSIWQQDSRWNQQQKLVTQTLKLHYVNSILFSTDNNVISEQYKVQADDD